ncbi:ABC transporter substrate-binding protein [Microbacterium stercoris]|uniref:Extracellular solute-binding protein n=1 Tax=Microbacterium stercoris TaxID=2820289 RepID=A0A939QKL5_9MICO|nr:extracellular solute-binding protein [Microbacterium stercoris]MBO3664642.1 extracellular solute-binding protein [Microbacterium stercoris]
MNIRRIIGGAAIGALGIASLAGCAQPGGSPEPEYTSTVDQEAGEDATTLSLWTFVELHGEFYENMAKVWNEENPDKQVKIDVSVMPYDDMHNKLQLALNSGQGVPDVVDIEVSKFPGFTQGEPALVDLTEAAAPYVDDIVKARLDLYSKDGALYGLDMHVGTTVAYYNTELLESADIDYTTIKTWDDFKAAGVAYKEATGKEFGTADTSAMWQEAVLLGQLGGDYADADGNPTVDSPEVAEALALLKDLQDSGAEGTIAGGQPDTEEAYGAINNGDFAAFIMPSWFMSRFTSYMPDLAGKIAVAPVPVMDGAEFATVGGGGTGTAVPSAGENSDLAAEYAAFAKLSYEGNVMVWEKLGFDPLNTEVWADEAVTHNPDNEFVKYFVNNPFDAFNAVKDSIGLLQSQTTPAYPAINNNFTTVTLNEVFENGTPIEDALKQAQSDLENELG